MEAYDIIMLVVLGAATLWGALKGLAWQVASLASMIVSYLVAYRFRGELAPKINAEAPWNVFLAMLILYVASSSLIWLLFRVLSTTIERMKMKDFDRQLGAIFGFGKGVLFCAVVTLFAATLLGETARQSIVRSKSGHYIARLLHDADSLMPEEVKAVLGPYLEDFDNKVDPDYRPREAGGGESISWDRIMSKSDSGDGSDQSSDSVFGDVRQELEKSIERGIERGVDRGLERTREAFRETLDSARRTDSGSAR
ncbi:MAG: CvpA family protein [Pirellulales bacterium]